MKKIVLVVILLAAIFGMVFWWYTSIYTKPQTPKEVDLTVWGLWDEESVIKPVLEAYQASYPNVRIKYVKQSITNYYPRLTTQLRSGAGPDVFTIHNSWLPMMSADLAPAPSSIISFNDFSKSFYPIAKETLTAQNRVYGLPVEVDGLVMFYNEDILKGVNASVPKDWREFAEVAKKVTVTSKEGQIQTSGAALGSTNNVDFWPEIIGMLYFQQPNADVASPKQGKGPDVIRFYTDFITDPRKKTWDINLPSSGKMFTEGKLALYFAPARIAQEIKNTNPNLQFKVAPVPQLPAIPGGAENRIIYGGFWAQAVSARSAFPEESWKLVKYLTTPQVLQVLYQQHLQARNLGRPFPRVEMANLISSHPIFGPVVTQAPYYKSWYLNSTTGDAGINDKIIEHFKKAVDGVLAGQELGSMLDDATLGINKVINSYQPQPTPIKK